MLNQPSRCTWQSIATPPPLNPDRIEIQINWRQQASWAIKVRKQQTWMVAAQEHGSQAVMYPKNPMTLSTRTGRRAI
jgi:hypothetical protein